ncbi:hypothetical protein QBC47DRAFT_431729 [Echria macrotheca]|uniref:Uncharacterized protein n=1 Tax=Echria macrotheca TaxID=438768 RepID=A0AAJ0B7T3_9PEZI|nr:hypothetical protein QBC47DRAFT_431729 [Echria macrotheca]
MAPINHNVIRDPAPNYPLVGRSEELRDQIMHPVDIFSVLLLLGGDVVGTALAQLAGRGLAPVAFSFGWVSYSMTALLSSVGENYLMPTEPDCRCKVINGKSGYSIDNTSWILGRVMRDFGHWMNPLTKQKLEQVLNSKWTELRNVNCDAEKPSRAGLVVAIYRPRNDRTAGHPQRDRVYWSGILAVAVQLGIAAIPCALYGDWAIIMITVAGTALALWTGLLGQWGEEKWACRAFSNDTYVLTRGNGSQYAIVVLGNGHGLNMEDLAMGQHNLERSIPVLTRATILLFVAGWVMMLLCAAGVRENTWYLLAVGGVGNLQNVFAAGWHRRPENFGIYLDFVDVFGRVKVMDTLLEVERRYPALGRSMLHEFFPGNLRADEIEAWKQLETGVKEG